MESAIYTSATDNQLSLSLYLFLYFFHSLSWPFRIFLAGIIIMYIFFVLVRSLTHLLLSVPFIWIGLPNSSSAAIARRVVV